MSINQSYSLKKLYQNCKKTHMLVGITNQWTEVDWTGLDSQKCQK